jgi:hypothetical protein
MPNRDFMALGEDHRSLLEFIFQANDCRVFESYSLIGREIAEFKSVRDIETYYGMTDWITFPDTWLKLVLYPNDAGGRTHIERIEIRSRRRQPATFRYAFNGWGFVHLMLVGLREGWPDRSWTNHNSEKRASHGAMITDPQFGSPFDWNWKAVSAFSRRLIRYIDKAAVTKRGAMRILPQAATTEASLLASKAAATENLSDVQTDK